jgi:hypothetical protein
MESDTVPIRSNWLDRLYYEVAMVPPFWVKGSIYRGPTKPLEYCYSLCGCAEHMNGNSIYRLGDHRFNEFLNKLYNEMNFDAWNYDAYMMNMLKREENFAFFQEYAHKFVYTEFLQHGQNGIIVKEVLKRYPDTFMLHQAR